MINTKFKQTEIGEIPENWSIDKLINLSEKIGSGATPRGAEKVYKNEGVSLIRSQNILLGSFDKQGLVYIDEDEASKLSNVTVKNGDILLNITGDSVARVSLVDPEILPARVNQHVSIIRSNEKVNNKYLFYFLLSHQIQDLLLGMSMIGATRKALTKSMIENLEVSLPPINEQKQIASILSSLDDKIELNQKTIKTLEEIGQALFKRWFVDFEFPNEKGEPYKSSGGEMVDSELGEIPRGWSVNNLDSLSPSCVGGDWGKENEEDKFNLLVQCIRGADIPELKIGNSGKMPKRYVKNDNEKILIDRDIIIEISGGSPTQSTGRSVLITNTLLDRYDSKLICSNFCRILRFKEKKWSIYFSYYLNLIYLNDGLFQYENGTTGIKNLDINSFIKNHTFVLPDDITLGTFNNTFEVILSRIQNCGFENERLSNIRDSLLPKLLSGKIRV